MIGIYKIKNRLEGKSYIGKSLNIQRRWMEHRTPKARGNDRLHDDIQRLGVENFDFEILEECSEDELSQKELSYIKKYKPFYNTVGKKVSDETKRKISESTKRWWNNLPDEKKECVIAQNLKGPSKGHIVTAETRKKISRKISEIQKQKVKCIETGEIFNSVADFENYVGACTGTCAAYWKGKIKSVKGFHVEKCRD